jgi:type IV secretory pathway VirB10-like protein
VLLRRHLERPLPSSIRDNLTKAVERIGAKLVDGVRIDTTHFVTTEGRGQQWEKAVESNIPVVRPEWVEACEKGGRILGVTKFYLDAMKPGPPAEESTPPPPPEKEEKSLPVPPSQNGESASRSEEKLDDKIQDKEENEKKEVEAPQGNGEKKSSSDSSSEDDEDVEVEQKAMKSPQEEQKVRFEDKEEQKVALRPASNGESVKAEQDNKQEKSEDESEDETTAKTTPTPDGASFQEVEL